MSIADSFPSDTDWQRLAIVGGVLAVAAVVAWAVDHALARRTFDPQTLTLLKVVRKGIRTTIILVGVLAALLVVPEVRAAAGAIFASSALIGLVVGFAARTTLANVVAGVMIAFTQPLRIGDDVQIGADRGEVEEIELIYTFIRLRDGTRLVIPNEKLASEAIRNATIRRDQALVEVTVKVAVDQDLEELTASLQELVRGELGGEVFVSDLADGVSLTVRARTRLGEADRLERDLRLRVHSLLRERGALRA